jgi:hypothetical protein
MTMHLDASTIIGMTFPKCANLRLFPDTDYSVRRSEHKKATFSTKKGRRKKKKEMGRKKKERGRKKAKERRRKAKRNREKETIVLGGVYSLCRVFVENAGRAKNLESRKCQLPETGLQRIGEVSLRTVQVCK